jgi:S1-C subfamily serine protease
LSYLCEVPLLTVYPAGPGDSGGGIFNERGELVGMMFAGIQIACEEYVFSYPVSTLQKFLTDAGLEKLL